VAYRLIQSKNYFSILAAQSLLNYNVRI